MSLSGLDLLGLRPGKSPFSASVIQENGSIGEQYPRKCELTWKPPIEDFIFRQVPATPEKVERISRNDQHIMPAGLVLGKDHYRRQRNGQPIAKLSDTGSYQSSRPAAGLSVTSVLPFNIM